MNQKLWIPDVGAEITVSATAAITCSSTLLNQAITLHFANWNGYEQTMNTHTLCLMEETCSKKD
jgi:hypothetical protein